MNFLRSRIQHQASHSAFSLLELLIVIGLIGIIAAGLLIALNPKAQINKANDAKRKQDLSNLKKKFEDYYNDHSCYPKPAEVCNDNSLNCTICGNYPPRNFEPYMNKLPCDPENPNRKYLYSVDNTSCPTAYRIYGSLANESDLAINEVGCQGNICGPYSDSNYGISSPNVGLEYNGNVTPTPTPPGPTNPASPTPAKCQIGLMYKKDGEACNSYGCTGQNQDPCMCTPQDPCYSNYPGCNITCEYP